MFDKKNRIAGLNYSPSPYENRTSWLYGQVKITIYGNYWTSTEYFTNDAVTMLFGNYRQSHFEKANRFGVHSVLAF